MNSWVPPAESSERKIWGSGCVLDVTGWTPDSLRRNSPVQPSLDETHLQEDA